MAIVLENTEAWRMPIDIKPVRQAFFQQEGTDADGTVTVFDQPDDVRQYRNKKMVFDADHQRLFGVFPKKTTIVPHSDIIDMLEETLREMFKEEPHIEITALHDGASIFAKALLPGQFIDLDGGNDRSQLQVLAYNSYTPNMKRQLRAGAYRQVCSNGMVMGRDFGEMDLNSLLDGWTKNTLKGRMTRLMDQARSVQTVWEQWAQLPVPFAQAERVITQKFPKLAHDKLLGPASEYPINKWLFYNQLTQYATHQTKSDAARVGLDTVIAGLFYGATSPIADRALRELVDADATVH